jgi:hypothetical protein
MGQKRRLSHTPAPADRVGGHSRVTITLFNWYITDSVGLLSDAMESLVNLASAIFFGLVMVTIAAADEKSMGTTRPSTFPLRLRRHPDHCGGIGHHLDGRPSLFDPQPIEQVG